MSRICSARHGDGARVVVDCRCPKAAPHWPWVAGVADPKMVGRFAGCCASAVSGYAARDARRLLRCGISAGLMPLRVKLIKSRIAQIWSGLPQMAAVKADI